MDFHLVFPSKSNLDELEATEQCFRTIVRRNVEQIVFNAGDRSFFRVPATCLFDSQSLVILKLIGMLKIELPEKTAIQLLNLKKLSLCDLLDVPVLLCDFFECCPLLEDLQLKFDLISLPQPQNPDSLVNVDLPNLKSLEICMNSSSHLQRSRIYIHAPKLANISIRDCYSFYSFVTNPIVLVDACIDLRGISMVDSNEDVLKDTWDRYVIQMFFFFGRLSNVKNLELMVENRTNIFTRLRRRVDLPVFHNLTRLKTNCFKDLVRSLRYFPNLEHLEVKLWAEDYDPPVEHRDYGYMKPQWSIPLESVPDCLVSKLKIIRVEGLKGDGNDSNLLSYILGNAMVLEELCAAIRIKVENGKASDMSHEHRFFTSLYSCRRSSSTCEIIVSKSVKGYGDVFRNGYATYSYHPSIWRGR